MRVRCPTGYDDRHSSEHRQPGCVHVRRLPSVHAPSGLRRTGSRCARGTEIFQTTPSQIVLSQGAEHLRCLRLSAKGLLRWYAGCCRLPLVNTIASAQLPFAGVIHNFMDFESSEHGRNDALGPVLARVEARFAVGPPPKEGPPAGAARPAPPEPAPPGPGLRPRRASAVSLFRPAHGPASRRTDGPIGSGPRQTSNALRSHAHEVAPALRQAIVPSIT